MRSRRRRHRSGRALHAAEATPSATAAVMSPASADRNPKTVPTRASTRPSSPMRSAPSLEYDGSPALRSLPCHAAMVAACAAYGDRGRTPDLTLTGSLLRLDLLG